MASRATVRKVSVGNANSLMNDRYHCKALSSYQLVHETKVRGSQAASGCTDESLHDVLGKPNCPIVVPKACRRPLETI